MYVYVCVCVSFAIVLMKKIESHSFIAHDNKRLLYYTSLMHAKKRAQHIPTVWISILTSNRLWRPFIIKLFFLN